MLDWLQSIGSNIFGDAPKTETSGAVGAPTAFGKATGLDPFIKMFTGSPAASPTMVDTPFGPRPAAPNPDAGGPIQWLQGDKPMPYTDTERADIEATGSVRQAGDFTGSGVSGKNESKPTNYFGTKNEDGSYSGGINLPNYQRWGATGVSGGNRQSDQVGRVDPATGKVVEGQKVGAPEVYQPNLGALEKDFVKTEGVKRTTTGAGYFHDSTDGWQSKTDVMPWEDPSTLMKSSLKYDPGTGKGSLSGPSYGTTGGFIDREGYRATAASEDGRHVATAEAGTVVSAGYNAGFGLDSKKGIYGEAGAGGKAGLYAQGDANTKTEAIEVNGQKFDAGIGVHGDTFLGAKGGANGMIGIHPDFLGAKGSIGAFLGAEAAGDVHGNLGPLGAKLGGSLMAGAGAGADGELSFKDGKLNIGGKLFASLGYGGSVSLGGSVDFGAIAKAMGPDFGPAFLDVLGGGINGLAKGIGGVAGGVGNTISALGAVGGGLIDGIGSVGGGLVDGAGSVLGGIGSGLMDVGGGALSGLGDVGGGFLDGAQNVLGGLGSGFSNFAEGDVLSGLGDIAGGIGGGILDVGGGMVSGAGSVLGGIGSGLLSAGGGLVSGAGNVLGGIGSGLADVGGGVVGGIGNLISGVGSVAGGAIGAAGDVLGGIGSAAGHVGDFIASVLPSISLPSIW